MSAMEVHQKVAPETMEQDRQHLKLLSVFHYVMAGIMALTSCVPLIHLTIGLLLAGSPAMLDVPADEVAPARLIGGLIAGFAAAIILFGWLLALMVFLCGRNLIRRRRYIFCMVIAALLCTMMPLGTILGVCTIIVLARPSVKASFA